MPKITFVAHTGESHTVEAAEGHSVMEAAVNNGVPGIDADCGGAAACGTCLVFIDPAWIDKTGRAEAGGTEAEMLSLTDGTNENSRLCCQVNVTKSLDGLVVRLPQLQH